MHPPPSPPTARRAARAVCVLVALALAAATPACGNPTESSALPPAVPDRVPSTAAAVLAAPTLHPGDHVPAPDEPVLIITGRIAAHNVDGSLRLGAETLDRLGLLEVHVYEPWVKQELDFQGVWLADLLAVAQTDEAAQSLHFTALDDYQIDLSVADVRAGGVFLATRTGDGRPIPVDEGGPTRIVFTDGVRVGASADQWIWSLTTIDVR